MACYGAGKNKKCYMVCRQDWRLEFIKVCYGQHFMCFPMRVSFMRSIEILLHKANPILAINSCELDKYAGFYHFYLKTFCIYLFQGNERGLFFVGLFYNAIIIHFIVQMIVHFVFVLVSCTYLYI